MPADDTARSGFSVNTLVAFDWKVKMVGASNDLAVVNKPLADLSLTVKDATALKTHNIELGKSDLDRLIKTLESANESIQKFSSK